MLSRNIMKGRRAIKFYQWLAVVITTILGACLSAVYTYFVYQTPTVEKLVSSYSFARDMLWTIISAFVVGSIVGAFMVYYIQDRFSDKPYGYTIIALLVSLFVVFMGVSF